MPNRPGTRAGAVWAVHSVPVRARDGGERLDQVYRRMLGDTPTAAAPLPGADARPVVPPPVPDREASVATQINASSFRQKRRMAEMT
jgi:hypothetical protein